MQGLIISWFVLAMPLLGSEDLFTQAQRALAACKQEMKRKDYRQAYLDCHDVEVLLRGQRARDARTRAVVDEAADLLRGIVSTQPSAVDLQVTILSPGLGAGAAAAPGACGSDTPLIGRKTTPPSTPHDSVTDAYVAGVACSPPQKERVAVAADILRMWLPQPVAYAELIPRGELQVSIAGDRQLDTPSPSSANSGSLGLAVRYRLAERVEAGASWVHGATSSAASVPGFDVKLAFLRGRVFRPTATVQAGATGRMPFVNIVGQNRVRSRAAIRYNVGTAWNGAFRKPAVVEAFAAETPANPNPLSSFSTWTYGAALDYRVVKHFQVFSEIDAGVGYSRVIPQTRVFRTGVAWVGRSVMLVARASFTTISSAEPVNLSRDPRGSALGASLTYRLRLRNR